MNWKAVRKTNAARSARKARRERHEAEKKTRIAAAGGPITAAEVRGAVRRMEPPAPGYNHEREVWTFRGRDWVLAWWNEDDAGVPQWWAFCPFCSYRQDPRTEEAVPMTPGARKVVQAMFAE